MLRVTHDLALSYASGVGGGRSGVIETAFGKGAETDLFGERAVLCGSVVEPQSVRALKFWSKTGYAPEMAYFECLQK